PCAPTGAGDARRTTSTRSWLGARAEHHSSCAHPGSTTARRMGSLQTGSARRSAVVLRQPAATVSRPGAGGAVPAELLPDRGQVGAPVTHQTEDPLAA